MWSNALNWLFDHGLFDVYARDMRGGLFSGFLTISGFLYSTHTFIIAHMRKEVYDLPRHSQIIADKRQLQPATPYYGSLRNLSRFILASVALSAVTSLSQFTVGLLHYNWTALLCLTLAALTGVTLVTTIVLTAQNLSTWFSMIEEEQMCKSGDEAGDHQQPTFRKQ